MNARKRSRVSAALAVALIGHAAAERPEVPELQIAERGPRRPEQQHVLEEGAPLQVDALQSIEQAPSAAAMPAGRQIFVDPQSYDPSMAVMMGNASQIRNAALLDAPPLLVGPAGSATALATDREA